MPSDLSERIVGLVDTAAPPIDVDELAHRLAEGDELDAARRAPSLPPLRHRILAFAGAFAAALVLVGGALAAGAWLHEPAPSGRRGFTDAPAAGTAAGDWWWLALVVVVVAIGAVAVMRSRRRTQRPGEEDAMQTMEKRTETTPHPEVETLKKQRRWLVVAVAFLLVAGAVAIGWLIAENQSLNSDLDAAEATALDAQSRAETLMQATVWPPQSELTAREQYMVDATERFWSAWDQEDFDTIMSLYAPTAVHGSFTGAGLSPVDGEHRTMMESWRTVMGENDLVQTLVVGSFVIHVVEYDFGQLDAHTFRFGTGDEPLIVTSYHAASTAASTAAG